MAWGGDWFVYKNDENDSEFTETLEGWETEGANDRNGDWDDKDDDSEIGDFYMSFANVVLAALVLAGMGLLIFLIAPALGGNFGFLNTIGVICMTIAFILMIVGAIYFASGHTAAWDSTTDDLQNRPDDGPWTAIYGSENDNDSEWSPCMAWYYFIAGGVFAIISLTVFRGAVMIDRSRAGRPIRSAYRDERYRPSDYAGRPPAREPMYRDERPRDDRPGESRDRYPEERHSNRDPPEYSYWDDRPRDREDHIDGPPRDRYDDRDRSPRYRR